MAKKKNRKISIIFLLSLIIHLSLLLMIISFAFKKYDEKSNKTVLAKNKKDELPASLKPRKSNFGTTVFFDDTPKFTPPKAPKMAEQLQAKTPEQKKAIQPPQKKQEIDEKILDEKKTYLTKLKEKPITEEKNIKEKIEKEKKEVVEKIKPIMAAEIIRNTGSEKKDQSPTSPKKKSILAMTKGFLQNLKDEGTDWIKRDGDDNKKPDLEDLKHISYVQKVFWQFQQETGIRHAHMSFQEKSALFRGFRVNPRVLLIINEKGNLDEISLALSSGSENFDKHILSSFKAASPYPPIPKHLNKKIYKLPVEIINPRK